MKVVSLLLSFLAHFMKECSIYTNKNLNKMRKFVVTFRVEGNVHNLEFMDNINNDKAREINAKMWINDYVQNQLGIKAGAISIISIEPVNNQTLE
jgi:hypothetical protein